MLLKEGMGFRATARVLGVSFSAVKQWFKDKSRFIKQAHDSQKAVYEIEDVELDELCHFVKKKEQNLGMVSSESFNKTSDRL